MHSAGGAEETHSPGTVLVVLVALDPDGVGERFPAALATNGDGGGLLVTTGDPAEAVSSEHDALAGFAGMGESTARMILSKKMYCP